MLAGRSEDSIMAPYMIPGVQQPYAPQSAFRPCNLAGALEVCDQEFTVTEKGEMKLKKKKTFPVYLSS